VSKQSSVAQWAGAIVVLVAAIVGGIYIWQKALHPDKAPVAAPAPVTTTAAPPATSSIQHPIEAVQEAPAESSTAPLPSLDASDSSVSDSLKALAGDELGALMLSDRVVLRMVATIDALPRQEIANGILPLHTPKGAFLTDEADGLTTISDRNVERYAPYMRIVENVDNKALVAWYVHNYPLFQSAYRELGYPRGYFNDRLVEVIDDMLEAPSPNGPVTLVKPKTFYLFSDPALQSLSVGQKLMIRVGPANEAKLKAKLRAVRSELTGVHLPPK
jgi:hypothetical protein